MLTFETLREINAQRGAQWDGKPASLDDLSFRGLEFVGEAGEAANFCKKLARHLTGRVGGLTLDEARDKIAEELADTVICADRIAELINVDLGAAVVDKFNKTSRKHGFIEIDTEALALHGPASSKPSPAKNEKSLPPMTQEEASAKFTRAHFIAKFEAIPWEQWCIVSPREILDGAQF